MIVTGAARGIGAATARILAASGASVVLNDMDAAALGATTRAFVEAGLAGTGVVADATDASGAEALMDAALRAHGRLDALVNNVGGAGTPERPATRSLAETTWEHMVDVYQRNVAAMFHCTRAAIPSMREHSYGRIVNVASLAGRSRSPTGGPAYAAAKAAVIGFTRHVSAELGPHGITINAVAPGLVFTERVRGNFLRLSPPEQEAVQRGIPLGRAATPEEPAAVIAFLCSAAAAYITGAVLDVNGGFWVG